MLIYFLLRPTWENCSVISTRTTEGSGDLTLSKIHVIAMKVNQEVTWGPYKALVLTSEIPEKEWHAAA